jgi:hypothetical protein
MVTDPSELVVSIEVIDEDLAFGAGCNDFICWQFSKSKGTTPDLAFFTMIET